jgi:hypothetical protein
MIWNPEESLNVRGRKIVGKKPGFPPKKLASNFFSSKNDGYHKILHS